METPQRQRQELEARLQGAVAGGGLGDLGDLFTSTKRLFCLGRLNSRWTLLPPPGPDSAGLPAEDGLRARGSAVL